MSVPYTSAYVVLCGFQAVAVLVPRPPWTLPFVRRRALLGLIPLVAIGGVVLAMESEPSLAQRAVDLAAFATPALALAGFVAFRIRFLAVLAPVAYAVAWKGSGRPADLATDALIVGACATLAWLTGALAPAFALALGILVASVVDVYQVIVTEQVQVVAQALHVAQPPAGLPRLQEAVFDRGTMGWGDMYLAALLGVVLAACSLGRRLEAALLVFALGLVNGFGFRWVDTVPATVPVAIAMLAAMRHSDVRRVTLPELQGGLIRWQRR
jgi:hypothetical protein